MRLFTIHGGERLQIVNALHGRLSFQTSFLDQIITDSQVAD